MAEEGGAGQASQPPYADDAASLKAEQLLLARVVDEILRLCDVHTTL
jgi:hypothetical protein